jgi:3-isopropylmalate/(R)-2-methylmalate dehydratase large subunit
MGIVHVVGPEQGLSLPGLLIVCGDSHTSTHGALGALAFGIGASEVAHVLASQTLWQRKPLTLRINIDGELGFGRHGEGRDPGHHRPIGAAGATGHVIEYAGSAIRALSMEGADPLQHVHRGRRPRGHGGAGRHHLRLWLAGRPYAPKGAEWDDAVARWRALPSDEGARFDREVQLHADDIAPMVTWGNSPEDALPITGACPTRREPRMPSAARPCSARQWPTWA